MNIEGFINGYLIKEKLFENEKTIIFRCSGKSDEDSFIIKVLNEEYPDNEDVSKFLYSYELMKDLFIDGVPQVIEVINIKQTQGIVFFDNKATSLNKIKFEMLSIKEKLKIFLKTVEIIERIHEAGIIHRDINPSNIIYNTDTGDVGIIDFEKASKLSVQKAFYDKDIIVGTLDYISPEQTGRMNRTVDYRTDYYSIGASFYEIFSGKKVFGDTLTAVELIYYHVAKEPKQLLLVNDEIPKTVSDIIMKLLSKNAEDRYQSAQGIIADIALCLEEMEKHGKIENFQIALRDKLSRFIIPEKLYGREKELSLIKESYSRVCNEGFEIVFVSGVTGIGKTSFIEEIERQIIKQNGYYGSGSFDKSKKNLPYYAYDSLSTLIKQILSEDEDVIENIKTKILNAVGKNGKILFEIVPELKYIIGEQADVENLPPLETKNRLLFTFVQFLKVFMTPEKPLTMFLDNCQWVSESALELISSILKAADIRYFMLVIAYKEEELSENGEFLDFISKVEGDSKANISYIKLKPLDNENVINIVNDIIGQETFRNSSIAKLVMDLTDGIPFLVTDYLSALNKNKYIYFDITNMKWQWDEKGAGTLIYKKADNKVIDAIISTCSSNAKAFLEAASVNGESFVLGRVFDLLEQDNETLQDVVWEVLEDKIIEPEESNYCFVKVHKLNTKFRFSNQNLHQSIYQKIDSERKSEMHLNLGEKMMIEIEENKNEKLLFDAVHHLNIGREVVKEVSLLQKIADLNYKAGVKARNSSSFSSALEYFEIAYDITSKNGGNADVNLLLGLMETAYSCSNDSLVDKFYEEALSRKINLIEKAKFVDAKINAYIVRGESKKAVDLSLTFLNELGIYFPRNPSKADLLKSLAKVKLTMIGKNVDEFPNMPILKDTKLLAVMSILNSASSSAFLAAPEVFMLIVMKEIEISIKHGNAPQSAYAFCKFGIILCGLLGDLNLGYRFGRVALQLIEKIDIKKYEGRTL